VLWQSIILNSYSVEARETAYRFVSFPFSPKDARAFTGQRILNHYVQVIDGRDKVRRATELRMPLTEYSTHFHEEQEVQRTNHRHVLELVRSKQMDGWNGCNVGQYGELVATLLRQRGADLD
jgi:hypothetical protein